MVSDDQIDLATMTSAQTTSTLTTALVSASSFGAGSSSFPSSMSSSTPVTFGHLIPVKLSAENFLLWKAQALPLLRTYGLMGYLDGSYPCPSEFVKITGADGKTAEVLNPEYFHWTRQEQAILSSFTTSMTPEVLGQVLFMTTAAEVWTTVNSMFASQSTARSMQIRHQLANTKKGSSSATAYFNRIKTLSDTLTSIGQPLRPEEFTSFLLAGLDGEYEGFISTVSVRDTVMPVRDVYAHLLNTEHRLEMRHGELHGDTPNHAVNAAFLGAKTGSKPASYRGNDGRGQWKPKSAPSGGAGGSGSHTGAGVSAPHGGARGHGNSTGGFPAGGNSGGSGGGKPRPICQLCGIVGHIASRCHKRFRREFAGLASDPRSEALNVSNPSSHAGSSPSYSIDPAWYVDSGATDHLTNELDKLNVKQPYNGKEQVYTANGQGSGYEGASP